MINFSCQEGLCERKVPIELKNRFISIILSLISIVSLDTICVFAGGNDIKTSKYQIKKKAPDTKFLFGMNF